jgi:electron transport complex protein RnfD
MLGTVILLATGLHLLNPERFADATLHLLSGSLMLGAFFIATDPVTSPTTSRGQLLFGAGCGALVYIIRTWGGYPEGVAFAVVLMNAVTPVIDYYIRPRIYGRTRRGQPLPVTSATQPPASLQKGD